MDTIRLKSRPLTGGRLKILGFKHAATVIIAAAVATGRRVRLGNVPEVLDIEALQKIVNQLGGTAALCSGWLDIDCAGLDRHAIPVELSASIHGAIYLMPALLGRLGRVRYQKFGGCPIGDDGARPIRHMLDVLRRFGAEFASENGFTIGTSTPFRACEIDIMDFSGMPRDLTGPMVSGATKTAILAALCVDRGETIIRNAYLKPDVTELLDFAAACGYGVVRAGGDVFIRPHETPADPADAQVVEFSLVSDISEVMTYASLSILTSVGIDLECQKPEKVRTGLAPEIAILDEIGIDFVVEDDVVSARKRGGIHKTDIVVKCMGIYSDHQPLFALMLCYATGCSTIREMVWRERFAYAEELNKLGASIERNGDGIVITPKPLHDEPAVVHATDVRAAAVLVVAGLVRGGETVIEGAAHLHRGYSGLVDRLARLGSTIEWLD